GGIDCPACGLHVDIRDRETGGFTVQMWEEHKARWATSGLPSLDPHTSTSNANPGLPASKGRRAKRTEEERIDYLRADPYVAQLDAYTVLCGICNKWIKLRHHSTYSSIPWYAHRKSCLAKELKKAGAYTLEERNTLFTKDPDIRKFDAERVLCNRCDQWLGVPADDHRQAVQKWLVHRAACGGGQGAGRAGSGEHQLENQQQRQQQHQQGGHGGRYAHGHGHAHGHHPYSPPPFSEHRHAGSPTLHQGHPSSAPSSHPSHPIGDEAEREAWLRADPLIEEVEPRRVLCRGCHTWLQLRKDTTFCRSPWVKHRARCGKGSKRPLQKQAELAELKRRPGGPSSAPIDVDMDIDENDKKLVSDSSASHPQHTSLRTNPGREEAETRQRRARPRTLVIETKLPQAVSSSSPLSGSDPSASGCVHGRWRRRRRWRWRGRAEARRERDGDAASGGSMVRVGLADLDSPAGRKQFLASSIHFLFLATYEASDDMSIAALLTYLNAAMPVDKHEDFDTSEVVRYVAALVKEGEGRGRGAGRVVLEGDVVRLSV
ncbi:hypothetical protein DFP72DRAFT_833203, partial [Ephemerocybe angulata]